MQKLVLQSLLNLLGKVVIVGLRHFQNGGKKRTAGSGLGRLLDRGFGISIHGGRGGFSGGGEQI